MCAKACSGRARRAANGLDMTVRLVGGVVGDDVLETPCDATPLPMRPMPAPPEAAAARDETGARGRE